MLLSALFPVLIFENRKQSKKQCIFLKLPIKSGNKKLLNQTGL